MRNPLLKLAIVMGVLASLGARAQEARLEVGGFRTVSNRFAIPNPGGSRVWVNRDALRPYARAQLLFPLSERGSLRILVAPLQASYTYVSTDALLYNGKTFPSATSLRVGYRFNSYRVGYIYRFLSSDWLRMYGGFVGKIRDAKIEVEGGGVSSTYDNVGFVPLLNFGFALNLVRAWELRFDLDGAAAKQGRAFDGSVEAFYRLSGAGSGLSAGIRVLEGGADNTKVYTFALIDYAFAAFTFGF